MDACNKQCNEGALGAYCIMLRFKPTLTFAQYNAITCYSRSNTQAFMDAVLTKEDFRFIIKEARKLDASKLEKKRREEQVAFDARVVKLKREKQLAVQRKASEKMIRLSKVVLIEKMEDVAALTIVKLDDQLDKLRLIDSEIRLKSNCGVKAERAKYLRKAIQRYWDAGKPSFDAVFKDVRVDKVKNIVPDWAEDEEDGMEY